MVALVFAVEVVGPVGVEVAVGVQGAEFEDGFGGVGAPAGAGDVHAVFDQVAAGAFNDAGGDGPPAGQGGGVVQVGGLGVEVAGGPGGGLVLGWAEVAGGGIGAQGGGDLSRAAVQDFGGAGADPWACPGAGLGEEAPGGVPYVFKHVDEIHQDGHVDAPRGGLGAEPPDLVFVAVGQRDPGPLAAGVAAVGLGGRGGHDIGGIGGDAGGQPLAGGRRAGRPGPGSQDVPGGARDGGEVEDRGDLGHPLAGTDL